MIDLSALPIDITSHILNFRNFLNSSWPWLDALMEVHDWDEDGDFTLDWLQVNWEFLVERELLGKDKHLLPLGWNNRITYSDRRAKYKIVCKFQDNIELRDWIQKKIITVVKSYCFLDFLLQEAFPMAYTHLLITLKFGLGKRKRCI